MSSKEKKTKVYFYQIVPEVEGKIKKDAINSISEIFLFKKSIYLEIKKLDGDISISTIQRIHSDRYCLGTLIFNQTNNVPPKYDGKNTEKIDLKKGEGLGHDSCFIFDSKTNIIAFESKMPGVNLGNLEALIKENYKDAPRFTFSMIIIPNEYQKFLNSTSYSRLEYSVARPTNTTNLPSVDNTSLGKTIDAFDDINAVTGTIVFSTGRNKKRSLNISSIRLFVQDLLKLNKNEGFLKTLKVTGVDIDDSQNHSKIFDLVSNRLVEEISVERKRVLGKFFTAEKYKQIEGLYLKHQPVLLKQYKIK